MFASEDQTKSALVVLLALNANSILALTHTLSHTHTLTLTLSLSLTHTHTHTHTHKTTHSHADPQRLSQVFASEDQTKSALVVLRALNANSRGIVALLIKEQLAVCSPLPLYPSLSPFCPSLSLYSCIPFCLPPALPFSVCLIIRPSLPPSPQSIPKPQRRTREQAASGVAGVTFPEP